MKPTVLSKFIEALQKMNIKEKTKRQIFKKLVSLKETRTHILMVGATGAGKSSTINALLSLIEEESERYSLDCHDVYDFSRARVGVGVDPETMEIRKYELGNIVLWDSPGLGDGIEEDKRHINKIKAKLKETDANGYLLIDLVLVILDGSSRDLGTSYKLINEVIMPNLGIGRSKTRLLIAMNKIDKVWDGEYWDSEKNMPEPQLIKFLDEQAKIVRDRVKETTKVAVTPVYYSAGGYSRKWAKQKSAYNLSTLLAFILNHTERGKRFSLTEHIHKVPFRKKKLNISGL